MKLSAMKRKFNRKWKYVLAVIPSLVLYLIFSIYPNLEVFPKSLYKWSPLRSAKTFVGLHNFEILFTVKLKDTLDKAGNTLMYIMGLFVIQTILSLILALALQKGTRKNKFFRAYFFLPMVFSTTMVSMTWTYMYDPNLGVINNLLGFLGRDGFPGKYLMSPNWQAILLIVLVHIWANIGYPIMIILSGLNTISGDLGEAARIDGANTWQTFTKITMPLLIPTLLRLSLMTISTGAMASDYIVMMGSRTANLPYDTWSAYMYKETLNGIDYGGVSACGVLMFFVLATASIIQFLAMRKTEERIYG